MENRAIVEGGLLTPITFSHMVHGEKFYNFELGSPRKSKAIDTIPCVISEKLLGDGIFDKFIRLIGQIRSYNITGENAGFKVKFYVNDFDYVDEISLKSNNCNFIGYIAKKSDIRETPNGRVITDAIIAVNNNFGRSFYIPCVFWSINAKYIHNLPVGTKLSVVGRFQSRDYEKKLSTGEFEIRTAYEISVKDVKEVSDD